MIKKFSKFEVAAMKRTIKNIAPLLRKKHSLEKQAELIKVELLSVNTQIDAYKEAMAPVTGGVDPEVIVACNGEVEIPENPPIPEDNGVSMYAQDSHSELDDRD